VVAASGAPLAAVAATTFAVDSSADRALTAGCDDLVAGRTLREALCLAGESGNGVVTVPAGTYTLTAGELVIDGIGTPSTVVVQGAGSGTTTIVAASGARVLNLDPSLTGRLDVTLTGLELRGGAPAGDTYGGGAVLAGTGDPSAPDALTLRDCVLANNANAAAGNTDQAAIGGAVSMSGGSLIVQRTSFGANTAYGAPGGAVAYVGVGGADTVSVTDSTFAGNAVSGGGGAGTLGGGALYVGAFGAAPAVSISGTVFSGNTVTSSSPSGARGSAIYVPNGTTSVTGSALIDNVVSSSAGSSGGAAYLAAGSSVTSSRLSGNLTTGGTTTHDAVRGAGVSVLRNWWGCADPRTSPDCDTAPDATTVLPAALLTAAASPTTALSGGTSTVTGSIVMSDASAVPAGLTAQLTALPVSWSTTSGSLAGGDTTLGNDLTGAVTLTLGASSATVSVHIDGTAASAAVTLVAPATVSNPANATVLEGTAASFTVSAGGSPAPTVTWESSTVGSSTWSAIAGASGPTLNVPGVTRALDGMRYRAVANNGVGAPATSAAATLTVHWGPEVGSAPASTTVVAGDDATFTVGTSGNPTPAVQWQTSPDGTAWTDVTNETSGMYMRTTTAADDGLRVRAHLTGATTVDTAAATLTVQHTGTLTGPADTSVAAGGTAQLTVAATGFVPAPTLQWQRQAAGGGWDDLSGETGTDLFVNAVAADDGAHFRVVATSTFVGGASATTTSGVATLTVTYGPVVDTSPADVVGLAGDLVTFSASAHGTPTPTLVWQTSSDGTTWDAVTGQTGPSYQRTLAAGDDGLQVRAFFTGAGTAASGVATITVQRVASITSDPSDATVAEGVAASFTVAVDGAPTPTVTWESLAPGASTWSPVSGASGLTLNVPATTRAMNGTAYRAVATNVAGPAATSAAATLTVQWGPEVTSSPADVVGLAGDLATFNAAAGGVPTPTLVWQTSSDGITWDTVTGQTGPSYERTLAAGDDGLQVRAFFTGAGTAATTTATITIDRVPSFTDQPDDLTVDVGDTAGFAVAVDGRPAPSVQWQSDAGGSWADLTGETGPTLIFTATDAMDGLHVRAVATSTHGIVTSDPATLTVLVGPTVTRPADVTTVPGAPVTFRTTATGRPAPTLTWQTSSDGVTWTDAGHDPQLTLTPALADDGRLVRVVATSTLVAGPATVTSAAATLTVMDLPVLVSAPPATTSATAGTPVSLRWVVLTSGGTPTWEVSRDGGHTWTAPPAGLATTSITGVGLVEVLRGAAPATRTAYVATLTPTLADDGLMVRLTVANAVGAMVPSATTLDVVAAAAGGGGGSGGGSLSSTGTTVLPLLAGGMLALALGVLALALVAGVRRDRRES